MYKCELVNRTIIQHWTSLTNNENKTTRGANNCDGMALAVGFDEVWELHVLASRAQNTILIPYSMVIPCNTTDRARE